MVKDHDLSVPFGRAGRPHGRAGRSSSLREMRPVATAGDETRCSCAWKTCQPHSKTPLWKNPNMLRNDLALWPQLKCQPSARFLRPNTFNHPIHPSPSRTPPSASASRRTPSVSALARGPARGRSRHPPRRRCWWRPPCRGAAARDPRRLGI